MDKEKKASLEEIKKHLKHTIIQKTMRKLFLLEGIKTFKEANKAADKKKDVKLLKTPFNWGKHELDKHTAELATVEYDIFTLSKYLEYIKKGLV